MQLVIQTILMVYHQISLRTEDFANLGILGDINEPLLALCLEDIRLNGRASRSSSSVIPYEEVMGSNELQPLSNQMWKELKD